VPVLMARRTKSAGSRFPAGDHARHPGGDDQNSDGMATGQRPSEGSGVAILGDSIGLIARLRPVLNRKSLGWYIDK
jgi:hypothetical protein